MSGSSSSPKQKSKLDDLTWSSNNDNFHTRLNTYQPAMSVQTQTATLPQVHHLSLRGQSPPDAESVGRSRLAEPLKYNGSMDKYPVGTAQQHLALDQD